jgi:hypothetical protein
MKIVLSISILLFSLTISAQTIKQKQVEGLIDSLNSLRSGSAKQVFETDNLINRMVNSTGHVSVATSAVNGFHEFDVKYDSAMVRGGAKGWYELFYTVYNTPSSTATVRYVAFHNKADLPTNIATTTSAGVITSTTYDVEIFDDGYQYPSFVKEYDSIGPVYYAFAYKVGTSGTYMKKGRTIADLQAYTPELVAGVFGIIDFAPVRNPRGGWVSGGFAVSPDGEGVILSAPSVAGAWKIEKYLFDTVTHREPAFKRQADGFIFFKGNRMFYMFQGLNLEHRVGTESHAAIVEVRNDSSYNLIGQPAQIIMDSLHQGVVNPVYLSATEEIWFATGTSIKYMPVSSDITPTSRGTRDVLRIEAGNKNEVTNNIPLNVYGTVTNSKIDGVTATGTGSGAWGFVDYDNFNMFDFRLKFIANTLPASTATILKIIGNDLSVFQVKVSSTGVVSAVITSNTGTVITYTISDLPVTVGSINQLIGVGTKTGSQFYLVKDNSTSVVYSQGAVTLTNLTLFSLFNDGTDSVATANQFNGTIISALIRKINPFVSPVNLDDVVRIGNTTTSPATFGDLTTPTLFGTSGQYMSMIGNTFYLVDNTNNTNTRLSVGGLKAGTYYGSSISQGDIITSGAGQFDAGVTSSSLGTTGNRLVARNSSATLYSTTVDPALIDTSLYLATKHDLVGLGGGITSLGVSGSGQTGATQTLATGTSGTDFGITSSSNTHTFNLPTFSSTARGLVTNGGTSNTTDFLRRDGTWAAPSSSADWNGYYSSATVVGSSTITLTAATVLYVFNGASPVTWTLPLRSDVSTNKTIYLKNRGTATLTISRNTTDEIWTSTNVTSVTLLAGESAAFINIDGYWNRLFYTPAGGSGTVTDASVVSANGFAGTVATSTTTPAITISTTLTGLLKGNGTAISAAAAGTDYVSPSGSITGTAAGSLINVQFLSSGTTYTPTAGTTKAFVILVGGGGGGGGVTGAASSVGAAGGGGGGGILMKWITSISGTYTYAIGSAGTAGANTGGTGGNGGNTTFVNGATTYTAFGGSGGVGQTTGTTAAVTLGGNGAVVSTNGDMNSGGSPGLMGYRVSGTLGWSGSGGDSDYGGAGNGLTSAGAGNNATGYGAGGGGALSTANTARAGGTGGAGLVIVYEYK